MLFLSFIYISVYCMPLRKRADLDQMRRGKKSRKLVKETMFCSQNTSPAYVCHNEMPPELHIPICSVRGISTEIKKYSNISSVYFTN